MRRAAHFRSVSLGRRALIALPWAWMLFFFVLPFALIVEVSLSTPDLAVPPYVPPFSRSGGAWALEPAGFARLAHEIMNGGERPYLAAFANSIGLAALTTFVCLLLGYPFAYQIARCRAATRQTLLMLVMLPFWTSFLMRIYAWMCLLDSSEFGLINRSLLRLGWISEPLPLLYSGGAVLTGMVYSYLPFMVLPLYANLVKLDRRLLEAANNLGAPPWRTFVWITLPLSLRGILAGSLLVFIPVVGEFVIPDLLGGGSVPVVGRKIWDDFGPNQDWPAASAVAVIMVLALLLPILVWHRHGRDRTEEA